MTRENAIKQLKMLKEHLKNDMYADDVNALNMAISALKQMDEVDRIGMFAALYGIPIRKGHWTVDEDRDDPGRKWDWRRFYCSECSHWQTYGKTKFCCHCGAEMERKE